MARMARLIIYDGKTNIDLATQLAGSLNAGIHEKGAVTITMINLSTDSVINALVEKMQRTADACPVPPEVPSQTMKRIFEMNDKIQK